MAAASSRPIRAADPADYAYIYDHAGNPTTVTVNGTPDTYSYDANNRLTGVCYGSGACPNGHQTWTYDSDGNRLTQLQASQTTTYTYDAADQLTSTTTAGVTTNKGP